MSGIVLLILRILAVTALYTFLGAVFVLLWKSINQSARMATSRQAPPISLILKMPGEAEQNLKFNQNAIFIGRDSDCDCVLADETVSARHAKLSYHHTQWWLDDLLSTNGTYLNNEPLQTPTVVVNGDTIRCGQITLGITMLNHNNMDLGELV